MMQNDLPIAGTRRTVIGQDHMAWPRRTSPARGEHRAMVQLVAGGAIVTRM